MGRAGLVALLMGLCAAPSARADLIWDRTNLVTDRGSLLAVVGDPDDPQVAWAASENRVWVTDDGGNAWYLVAQVLGNRRRQDRPVADDIDESDESDDDTDDTDDTDESDYVEEAYVPVEDLESPTSDRREERLSSHLTTSSPTPPVVRLRVLNERVFLTGDRGLWSIDRQARTLSSAVEVRLGRTLAIRDLVQAPWGPILLATSEGLREIDLSGTTSPGRGALGERDIHALVRSDSSIVAATNDGLWRVDSTGATRMGLVGVRRPVDVLSLPDGLIAIAATGEVLLARVRDGQILQRWSLNRITRLARENGGRLWAVGVDGAWSWTPADGDADDAGTWTHRTDGLGDRRLRDVAVPWADTPKDVHLWVVGRGGAWRRIPERLWISTQRERTTDKTVEAGAPPVWELLEGAEAAHRISNEHLSTMRRSGNLAFVLPTIEVEYQYRIRREEDLLTLPAFTEPLITQVQVYPQGHHLKVFAMWDVFPVAWALFDTDNPYSGPSVSEETVRALAMRNQVRNAIVGLYNLWAQRRTTWRTSAPPSPTAALKSILSLQHIEADLHVLSHGRFVPMTTLETILKGGNP